MRKSVAISVADQAILSLFNLALNAALISLAAPVEFGHYVFAITILLILTSLQNALVGTPISVIYPSQSGLTQRETLAGILSFDLVFRIAATAASVPLCLLTETDPAFLAAAAAVVFTSLARETQRHVAIAERRTRDLLTIDAIAVVIAILATVLLWTLMRPSVATMVGLAVGNVCSVWLTTRRHRGGTISLKDVAHRYRSIWIQTRWSLVGAATTEAQYRSYVFMLELFRDAAAIAQVQAGRLLLGPLPLLVGSWARIARPEIARRLAAGDKPAALRIVFSGLSAILAASLLVVAVLYLAWPTIEGIVYRGRYPGIGAMTAAWVCYTLVVVMHMVLSAPLVAALQLKQLAQVTMVTAVLSIVLLLGLALPVPTIYVVFAATLVEVVALIWIAILVARLFANNVDPKPNAPAAPAAAVQLPEASGGQRH